MSNSMSYYSFTIADTDGKTYNCSRKTQEVDSIMTQTITVMGIKSKIDPQLYSCKPHPLELIEFSAKALALEIIFSHV